MTREEAISEISKIIFELGFEDTPSTDKRVDALNMAIEALKQEPKTGHWITTRTFMHDGEYYCDKCKCDAPNNEKWDYCPNCGCRMVEPQEKQCVNCKHYGKLSLDCGRCDDDCSMYEPQESEGEDDKRTER